MSESNGLMTYALVPEHIFGMASKRDILTSAPVKLQCQDGMVEFQTAVRTWQ